MIQRQAYDIFLSCFVTCETLTKGPNTLPMPSNISRIQKSIGKEYNRTQLVKMFSNRVIFILFYRVKK